MTKRARKPETNGDGYRDRIVGFKRIPAGKLIPNEKNWRTHPTAQQDALKGVLTEIGIADAVIARKVPEGYQLLDGHLRTDVAPDTKWPVLIVDLDDDEADKLLATLDPLAAMAGASTDKLEELLASIQTGSDDMQALLTDLAKEHKLDLYSEPMEDPPAEINRAAELQKQWGTEAGQLWEITGQSGLVHRLLCGDSTKAEDVERLMDGVLVRLLISDPPYCSGGFQEAGKKSGSVGTRGDELIHNDQLSTRGYQALIKSAVTNSPSWLIYIFTDWRMWVNLFDVVENSGFGVRAMIVWNKNTPGMGRGWRSQHELIMCGSRESQPFDPHKAQGNVITCQRTGNKLHATEKPIELIAAIIEVSDMHHELYDPFLGSGTTLIAAENLGRRCFGMEISPEYVAVALERATKLGCKCTVG